MIKPPFKYKSLPLLNSKEFWKFLIVFSTLLHLALTVLKYPFTIGGITDDTML